MKIYNIPNQDEKLLLVFSSGLSRETMATIGLPPERPDIPSDEEGELLPDSHADWQPYFAAQGRWTEQNREWQAARVELVKRSVLDGPIPNVIARVTPTVTGSPQEGVKVEATLEGMPEGSSVWLVVLTGTDGRVLGADLPHYPSMLGKTVRWTYSLHLRSWL